MKTLNCLLCISIVVALISCRPNQNNCVKGMIDFETPLFTIQEYTQPLNLYNVGGLAMNLGNFTMVNGSIVFHTGSVVAFAPQPSGNGQVFHLNNTSLNFDLPTQTTKIELEYLDFGGTINIGAHGNSNPYIGNLSALPPNLSINGVDVTRYNMQDIQNPQGIKIAEKGILLLKSNSDIGSLNIGGQELYLDNFCLN
jgi:hypothetical protein